MKTKSQSENAPRPPQYEMVVSCLVLFAISYEFDHCQYLLVDDRFGQQTSKVRICFNGQFFGDFVIITIINFIINFSFEYNSM